MVIKKKMKLTSLTRIKITHVHGSHEPSQYNGNVLFIPELNSARFRFSSRPKNTAHTLLFPLNGQAFNSYLETVRRSPPKRVPWYIAYRYLYLQCEKYSFKCYKYYLTKNMILSIKLSNSIISLKTCCARDKTTRINETVTASFAL